MFLALAVVVGAGTPALAQSSFTDVAATAGIPPGDSNGTSIADYDGDGLEDIVLSLVVAPTGFGLFLFHNNGDGTFTDETALWTGLNDSRLVNSSTWADFDNDGFVDAAISVNKPPYTIRLARNLGPASRAFVDVDAIPLPTVGQVKAWGDYDNDGDLDLFVGHNLGTSRLFENDLVPTGTASFRDVSSAVGFDSTQAHTDAAQWIDADNDGDLDLYLTNNIGNGRGDAFYLNQLVPSGTATLVEMTTTVGFRTGGLRSFSVIFGDYDNDGDQDAHVGVGHFTPNQLYRNNLDSGPLSFTEVGATAGVQQPVDGGLSMWGDIDDDGDLDLVAGDPSNQAWVYYDNQLLAGGSPIFLDTTTAAGLGGQSHQSAIALFDMDGDGDLDIFAGRNGNGTNRLYRNDGSSGNWLKVVLAGTDSNRDGIGARLRVRSGGRDQFRQHAPHYSSRTGSTSRIEHFGLGTASLVDALEIRWPSGCVQTLQSIPANQVRTVVENCSVAVVVDIKPGGHPNSVNPRSKGVIPVAVLSTPAFDARQIDPSSAVFGPGRAGIAHAYAHEEDVNSDGLIDLLMHFRTQESGISCGDVSANLAGSTLGGQSFAGGDTLQTVGCK